MKCDKCNQEISITNPERYFIKMSCPNCGAQIDLKDEN